jgi:hypothetical protein
LAKQKLRSVQDNFTSVPNEQSNIYAQYFSVDQNDSSKQLPAIGDIRSHNQDFKKFRKHKQDQIATETTRLLLRLERLTSNDENVPKSSNPKERRSMNEKET